MRTGKQKQTQHTTNTETIQTTKRHIRTTMWTGSAAWRRRRPSGADEELSDVRADEDERVKRKKRQSKCGIFWNRDDTADRVVAAGMLTTPIRKVLGHMFAAERNARLHVGGFVSFVVLFKHIFNRYTSAEHQHKSITNHNTNTNNAGGPAVREKLNEAGAVPAPGHSYLGDVVKVGGFIDVGYESDA